MRLYRKLQNYAKSKVVPMHMPGHKRKNLLHNSLPYKYDITEIDGFDNLYHPEGILKECLDRATKLYKTKTSFYLVNGSTSGLLSSISALCDIGDKIILPRNCHKSVFNIVELLNLQCVFLPLDITTDGICKQINPTKVEEVIIENQDAKCVILTSPTYEGIISDIESISKIVHKYGLKLIVDEAHGAHLFMENKSAINKGADIVINSLHKTLPSLTQTALLHICSENVDILKVKKSIATFNSSSPSYILMASIDECIYFLQKKGLTYYNKLKENLNLFYEKAKNLQHLKLLCKTEENNIFDFDNTKIVIITSETTINGFTLANELRKNNIEIEMSYTNYCICMSTIFDDKDDLFALLNALEKIDEEIKTSHNASLVYSFNGDCATSIREARLTKEKEMDFDDSIGKISGDFVWVYPPGVPILVPGEKITENVYNYISFIKKNKLNLQSSRQKIEKNKIYVLDK